MNDKNKKIITNALNQKTVSTPFGLNQKK
jgi:hypothetical protein